jgi:hypothetical protein
MFSRSGGQAQYPWRSKCALASITFSTDSSASELGTAACLLEEAASGPAGKPFARINPVYDL